MIAREIVKDPLILIATFDFFSDYKDTRAWLAHSAGDNDRIVALLDAGWEVYLDEHRKRMGYASEGGMQSYPKKPELITVSMDQLLKAVYGKAPENDEERMRMQMGGLLEEEFRQKLKDCGMVDRMARDLEAYIAKPEGSEDE